MQIAPNETPGSRLLVTGAAEHWSAAGSWTGNAFAIFAGCSLGLLLLCAASTFVITRHTPAPLEEAPRMIPITTKIAAKSPRPVGSTAIGETIAKPTPVTVQLTPEMFKVTAISLGHPRFAVINRQQVAEGEWIEVATPTAKVGVKLRDIKIADGNIELAVGEHVLTVPLEQLKLKSL